MNENVIPREVGATRDLRNGTIAETFFSIIWRFAILTLPWQTRWFSDVSLAGWPWEQGRLAFYASWFFILGTILFQPFTKNLPWTQKNKFIILIGLLIFISLAATGFNPPAVRAVIQWWIQILFLVFFGMALQRAEVSHRSLAAWFVISLLPHMVLGFWQFATQEIVGHAWLGIASQNPQNLGVSVIEANGTRILRSYGGFPHPNIFGGWLAIGIVAALWLTASSRTKFKTLFWAICTAVISTQLVLTFSRGAWLAAAVGVVSFLFFFNLRKSSHGQKLVNWKGVIMALIFSGAAIIAIIWPRREIFLSRFTGMQRLEIKSFNQRELSLKIGWEIFLRHPLIGTGPNAELVDQAGRLPSPTASAPLEPPHNAFLLALTNIGVLGLILWLLVLIPFFRKLPATSYQLLATLAILALFDHYLWSTWSGQALLSLAIFLQKPDP